MFLKTSERFWWQMRQLNKHNNLRKDSAYAFDSAWVVAMALDSAFAKGMKYEKLLNRKFKQVVAIRNGVQNINFPGLTVSIIYDNTADFELSVLSISIMLHFLLRHRTEQKNCFGCRQKLILNNNIPQFFLKIPVLLR